MAPKFKRPLPGAPMTSLFGMRGGKAHKGIDIAAAPLTPVGAAAAGKVTRSEWYNGYGNCVDINHGGGYVTRYGHLAKRSVAINQTVTQGQTIGLEGSTGDSTGPHLHFEIHVNGKAVNPLPFLTAPLKPPAKVVPKPQISTSPVKKPTKK